MKYFRYCYETQGLPRIVNQCNYRKYSVQNKGPKYAHPYDYNNNKRKKNICLT